MHTFTPKDVEDQKLFAAHIIGALAAQGMQAQDVDAKCALAWRIAHRMIELRDPTINQFDAERKQ